MIESFPQVAMSFSTELGKDGYVICKAQHSSETLQNIRDELTVAPKSNPQYDFGPVRAFPNFRETNNRLLLPRHYGIERFGPPQAITFPEKVCMPKLQAKLLLRDNQIPVAEAALKAFRNSGGGILQLFTGAGKTVLALYLVCQLQVKTLIIVHKSVLLSQWKERINEFIPNARVGIIQAKKVDTDDKDVIIGSLQSLAMKEYDAGLMDDIELVVCDECHHFGAEVFSRALPKVGARYTLGLSATPDRKDGLTKVFKAHLGDVIYKMERQSPQTIVKRVVFHSNSHSYCQEKRNFRGTLMLPSMINNITAHMPRNLLLLQQIIYYLSDEDRQIMVMGDRIAHLEWLHAEFESRHVSIEREGVLRSATSGLYIGRMKQAQLDCSAGKDVIFASSAICREGLDIASLNTLLLATPVGDVVQATGRIMRKSHAVCPLILDIVDAFSVFHGQAKKRSKFYTKSKFQQFTAHYEEGSILADLEISVESMLSSDEDNLSPESSEKQTDPVTETLHFLNDSDSE